PERRRPVFPGSSARHRVTLLAPAWLILAALAGVILVLHARRRRRLEVPSIRIWQFLEPSSMRQRTLRWPPPSLLLLLQIAAVLLIAFALAQPRFGTAAKTDHAIYVIDASGSM